MKKPQFIENEVYHIYNRGVDKRDIFIDEKDYFRFIHDLFEMNNDNMVVNMARSLDRSTFEVEPRTIGTDRKPRDLLVEILVFTLMPNHFHLILRQRKEGGIVKFMQKLGTGYTMYFNQKRKRSGALFQGRFKAILIKGEEHLIYLPYYIHFNPLDLIVRGSTSNNDALTFLASYRWSSFLDYIGENNFPSVTSRNFLQEILGQKLNYQETLKEWILEKQRISEILNGVTLE